MNVVQKGIAIDWQLIIDDYLNDLKLKNLSHSTITWYSDIIHRYFNFLEQSCLIKPVDGLGKKELKLYIAHLQKATRWQGSKHKKGDKGKLSPYTIQGHVRAIKAFWSWLYEEGHIEGNTLAKYPLPKVPKSLVKTLTVSQVKSLLGAVDKNTAKGAMYYCVLLLLLDTGMRVGEMVGIRLANMNLLGGFIAVIGKGKIERVVPFHKVTRKELKRYINKYRADLCSQKSPYLFPRQDSDHITINSVQQYVRRLAAKIGLQDVKCHPHIFRHTFATIFIAKGGSDVALMEILGHSSLQTTQKYTHLQPQHLHQQHAKYSPMGDIFPGKH